MLRDGRSLTVVRVDLHDERDRLATTATVSLAAPSALHPLDAAGDEHDEADVPARWRSWSLPPGVDAPIITLLEPRLGTLDGGVAVDLALPWDEHHNASTAEAACVAGDLCVGPPVAAACTDRWLPHPNPDLALRFSPVAIPQGRVTGVGRVVRISAGLAVVGIEVHAGRTRFASGAATSLVLRGEGS